MFKLNNFFVLFIKPSLSTPPCPPPNVPSISPVLKNTCSHQPTSVPVLTAPLSVLGVCVVGFIPIASLITPIYSHMSVLSACPPIISFYNPVSLSSAAPTVMLLTLSPVSEMSPLFATIAFPVVISDLVS